MRRLLEHNSVVLAILVGIFLVVTIILLTLWMRSRSKLRFETAERINAERDRLDVDVELQEQLGRLRIVRELHELAVHSVSVIIDQAEGAQYAAETDPTAAVRSAAVIADSARSTLADLRRVMTVVGGGEAVAASIPQFQTTQDLFAVMGDSGLTMSVVEMGERFEIRPGAELAIFRILQESLSNALTYGGVGTSVKVTSTWTEEGLQLLVDDDGIATAARRNGLDPTQSAQSRTYTFEDDLHALTAVIVGPGISEMRERAALFGGILNAYTVPGVGFSVSAVFPALRYNNGVHGVNLGV